jgi:hypothetical protein
LKIVDNSREIDCFKLKRNSVGLLGFYTIQKCTVVLRMLAYGMRGDTHDDYMCMAKSSTIDCMYMFCRVIIALFERSTCAHPMQKTQLGS